MFIAIHHYISLGRRSPQLRPTKPNATATQALPRSSSAIWPLGYISSMVCCLPKLDTLCCAMAINVEGGLAYMEEGKA